MRTDLYGRFFFFNYDKQEVAIRDIFPFPVNCESNKHEMMLFITYIRSKNISTRALTLRWSFVLDTDFGR